MPHDPNKRVVTPENERDEAVRRVLPLLKEYTRKLNLWPASKIPGRQRAAPRLIQAGRLLAQFTSQRLQSLTDDVLRLEAQLRLAEFEAALNYVDEVERRRRGLASNPSAP